MFATAIFPNSSEEILRSPNNVPEDIRAPLSDSAHKHKPTPGLNESTHFSVNCNLYSYCPFR